MAREASGAGGGGIGVGWLKRSANYAESGDKTQAGRFIGGPGLPANRIAAEAGAAAGKVKRAEGSVAIDRARHVQLLPVGSTVYVGDRIRTGADGSVGITLFDDTLLTAGPRSTLLISQFQFNPATQEGNLLATLVKGTLSVVTGLIGKQAPQNVRFQTPTVVLGIRGTEFIVEARGEGE